MLQKTKNIIGFLFVAYGSAIAGAVALYMVFAVSDIGGSTWDLITRAAENYVPHMLTVLLFIVTYSGKMVILGPHYKKAMFVIACVFLGISMNLTSVIPLPFTARVLIPSRPFDWVGNLVSTSGLEAEFSFWGTLLALVVGAFVYFTGETLRNQTKTATT